MTFIHSLMTEPKDIMRNIGIHQGVGELGGQSSEGKGDGQREEVSVDIMNRV